ncbi:hypothetical protein L6452_22262 [Arctium lappa]|uniref:Uncharacterized protein n=1 Tax=Arctium lappa TaxID=4217 RepID=A0ACB9B0K5_ARCLA|nr:hypothetical protein L6452_22262 [Arctium lappa]
MISDLNSSVSALDFIPKTLRPPPPPPNPRSSIILETKSSSSSRSHEIQESNLVPRLGCLHPTCSQKHLPGFVEKSGYLKSKGVDTITCISVNHSFIMKAWKVDLKIGDEVLLLSDGNGDFTKAIGCELDLCNKPIGLGVRARRYVMLVEDGI